MKLGRIYSFWPQIIGEDYMGKVLPIGLKTRPIKIRGQAAKTYNIEATLHVMTDSATALPLSYQKERILSRIEGLFGERMVNDIKIIQNHAIQKRRVSNESTKCLEDTDAEDIQRMISVIDDPNLRERLEKFCGSLYHSDKQTEQKKL